MLLAEDRLGLFLVSNVLISFSFLRRLEPFMKIINILFSTRLKEQKRWILSSSNEVHEMTLLSVAHDTVLHVREASVESSL